MEAAIPVAASMNPCPCAPPIAADRPGLHPTNPNMMTTLTRTKTWLLGLPAAILLATASLTGPALAQDEAAAPATAEAAAATAEAEAEAPGTPDEDLAAMMAENGAAFDFFTVSNLWILIAAALVFIMHLGFSSVETGMCQSKNTSNILFKNVFIVCMGLLSYAFYGYNAMYPGEAGTWNGFFALGSPFPGLLAGADLTYDYGKTALCMTKYTDFIFQGMFAATAATIVSGAVAERVKLSTFMIYATVLVTVAYPISGSWQWGQGWLSEMGFKDFAGSSLVHAFGGFAALAAIVVLGPRRGKYLANGKIKPILPHSTPLATIGVFLLFLGWFGFNGGSVLSASPAAVSLVFVTTALAGVSGGLAAMFTSWIMAKKPDLTMMLNGILAGLVGITAGADVVKVYSAVMIGVLAGILVVFSIIFLDRMRIDDPVGAVSVHGVCGIWGTVAVGIFSIDEEHSLITQIIGTLSISAFAFGFSLVLALALKAIMGIRVSEQEEEEGLDVAEHGAPAYHFGADASEV